jgi:type IV pilus assembly protein PilM
VAVATVTGIDVGATAVRAVEAVVPRKGDPVLRRAARQAFPTGAVRGGVALDPAALTRAVRTLWKEGEFGSKRVSLAASSPQVAVRTISLPDLAPAELKQALPFLVRDVVPIPVERAILDFVPTGERDSSGKRSGLLVALPSEGVTSIVRAIERAGLDVTSVDLSAFSALRALGGTGATGETRAIIDMGATMTTVTVYAGHVPLMVRSVGRGGDEIRDALSDRLGISRVEADELKQRVGLDETEDPGTAGVIRVAIGPLLAEIRSSLTYFASSHSARPQRLLLIGGGARLVGIRELLAEQQDLPVDLADPTARVTLDPGLTSTFPLHTLSASAIGLTLGDSVDHPARNSSGGASALFSRRDTRGARQSAAGVDPAGEIREAG